MLESLGWPSGSPHPLTSVTSSDKTLDCNIHWSRTPETEILGPAASQNTFPRGERRPGRDSRPQPHGSAPVSNPDSEVYCNDQNPLRKNQTIAKVICTREPFLPHLHLPLWGLGRGPVGTGDPPCFQHPEQRPALRGPALKMS